DDVPRGRAIARDAITAAEACGDDRLRADHLLDVAPFEFEAPSAGPKARAAVQKAKIAVDRVPQADLVARVDSLLSQIAGQDHRWDDAFAAAARTSQGFAARARVRAGIDAALEENELRFRRNELGDIQAVRASIAKWMPVAEANHFEREHHQLDR